MKHIPHQQLESCSDKFQIPGLVPGYELLESIGKGGFSLVYRARQVSTRQMVAVKILHFVDTNKPSYELNLERFEREIRLCAELHHPNIVKLLDKGETLDRRLFAVFEYIPGHTLKQWIKNNGAMDAVQAGNIMGQVLDALVCAHRHGVVHRDLKPQNVMVSTTGANMQVKILDYGIGTVIPPECGKNFMTLTHVQEFVGTPSYSAPEQLRGEPATIQTDLYAWGLLFLECLIGLPVMQGASTAEIFHKQLSTQDVAIPPVIAGHPLATILRRVLKKKVHERCKDAEALWHELQGIRLVDIVGQVQSDGVEQLQQNEATVINCGGFKEKRQITVVCCSVSVMPRLSDTQVKDSDIEVLEILQQEHFNRSRDIATQFGGKLAGCLGNRMLVYFGYPHVSDTDARRAARTALEINRVMRHRALQLEVHNGFQLHTRIGMHTGLMLVHRDEAPQGYATNIAMCLESKAKVNNILVSDDSFRCLERFFDFDLDETCYLSGNSLALQTHCLIGQRQTGDYYFLPALDEKQELVGNQQQLEWLKQKWVRMIAKVINTENRALLIQGEAGIGKSRLLSEMLSIVHEQGNHCYVCRCLPEHKNYGLFPFLELLQHSLDISEITPHADALKRLETEFKLAGCNVEQVMPIICTWLSIPFEHYIEQHKVAQVSPQRQKIWLLQAIIDWLIYLCKKQPLLLIVEDLHWSDPTSLELLEKLLERISRNMSEKNSGQNAALSPEQPRLLLMMSARPAFKLPWGDEVDLLSVNRLRRSSTEELIGKLAVDKKLHSMVIDKIVTCTDGVPLFVEELTRVLIDNHLVERDGYWRLKNNIGLSDIPLTLRDLLIGRLDGLAGAKKTAQIAAAIGREFDYELLACATFKNPEDLANDVATLVKSDWIYPLRPGDKSVYTFRHSLIRDAAYQAMLNVDRQETHRQIAFALSTNFPDRLINHPGEVANHYSLGGRSEKSSHYFVKAAHLASSTHSNQEAFNLYLKAIDDIHKVTQQGALSTNVLDSNWQNLCCEANEGLGDSASLIGEHTYARRALNSALGKEHKNREIEARILRKIAKSWEVSHEHEKSLRLYRKAEKSLGKLATIVENKVFLAEWLKINNGKLYVNYWDNNTAAMKNILDAVRPVVNRQGNLRQQAGLILDELLYTYRQTHYKLDDKTVTRAYELVDIAKQCQEPELLAEAWHELGLSLLFCQRYRQSQQALETAIKQSENIDDIVLRCRNLTYLTVTHRMQGQVGAVERIAQTTLDVAEQIAMTDYIAAAKSNLAWVAWRRGRYDEAYRLATQAGQLWHNLDNRYPYPLQWLGLLVLLAMKTENMEVNTRELMEFVDVLLNDNQQALSTDIRQYLQNFKQIGGSPIDELKRAIKTAKKEGLL